MIASLEPDDLRDAMRYPYSRFPVVEDGRLTGILNRAEIQIALDRGAAPKAGAAYDVRPAVIREIRICSSNRKTASSWSRTGRTEIQLPWSRFTTFSGHSLRSASGRGVRRLLKTSPGRSYLPGR